jgi:hypothetical protein
MIFPFSRRGEMSMPMNFIDCAIQYKNAREAYMATQKGRMELMAKKAFRAAYAACDFSDPEKEEEISKLAASVLGQFHNSFVLERERGLLQVKKFILTRRQTSLERFKAAAQQYEKAVQEAEGTCEFQEWRQAEKLFLAATLRELVAHTVETLETRLKRHQLLDADLVLQIKTWHAKFGSVQEK